MLCVVVFGGNCCMGVAVWNALGVENPGGAPNCTGVTFWVAVWAGSRGGTPSCTKGGFRDPNLLERRDRSVVFASDVYNGKRNAP